LKTTFLQQSLELPLRQIEQTLSLIESGATTPFIARYRKEQTGGLDEVQINDILRLAKQFDELEKRKESILKSIAEQGQLTPELERTIKDCTESTTLEDLYLPFKRKKTTRAGVARAAGLEPLAEWIQNQSPDEPTKKAVEFLNEQISSVEEAIQGASDIIAENISEDTKIREQLRRLFEKEAIVRAKLVKGKEEEGAKYRDYFDFEENLKDSPSHRILALRRAESEGIIRLSILPDSENALYLIEKKWVKGSHSNSKIVKNAAKDAYQRLIEPSIETEVRKSSKEKADLEAIKVFTENLKQLLLAPPLGQMVILAIDPGFRTGCKVVVIDQNGNLIDKATIFPHPPQNNAIEAEQIITNLSKKHQVQAIAVGNGTAGRETEIFLKQIKFEPTPQIFMVNESGASIYSASEIAREELPNEDITVRGAVSIGRRLMDPLAELIKIDPKSIGVGQYQHDVNQRMLKDELDQVVSSCVNQVGVNLNTAGKHLLQYISGLGPTLAENIVNYRKENGSFKAIKELLKVPRMGTKVFEQSAGFLRIRNAKNPLDNTGVHPERYQLVEKMALDLGTSVDNILANPAKLKELHLKNYLSEEVGMPTLKDILKELEKPGLDPRGQARQFSFTPGIFTFEDIHEGMIVNGLVNNITNFGAFVDIGIKESGLIHISNMANRFIKNPNEVVKLDQEVVVKIIEIDRSRKRIQLSLKDVE
jgi:uncharacterized protein